ncbi:DcaP family trimeric outer membrane transporter [Robertkochia aurantiaca]|uniref:DcaP family trimeric outer membrane transporter n=1 Tax=Robertkochia aurantiaca TaxID=2873700 RepID=UPI001CCDEDDF|nr:DcaP family trimeric outer membrane transporter [Robertkochia sp. 3YJGBD-33]
MNIKRTTLLLMSVLNFIGVEAQVQDQDTVSVQGDRIDDFRNNMIDYTGQDLIDASFPNSWPIFGAKARMSFGGYVKIDYLQDFNGLYDRFQLTLSNVQVPGDGRPEQSGYMNLFARESRFNVDFRGETNKNVPYRIFVEIDFYNLDRAPFNQTPRLRHAYGVLGRLLIGRTWGTNTDVFAVPVTIDFGVGDAVTGTRRAQIRWEDEINDQVKYAVGIEMLEYQGIDPESQLGQPSANLPLLATRITKMTKKGGRLLLGAQLFQLRWDPEGPEEPTTALGWGFNFSGREYFGKKKHFMYWLASFGNGYGSNILTLLNDGSAVVTPDNNLDTMDVINLGLGYNYNISEVLKANINGGYATLDPSEFRGDNKMKSGTVAHINLIWSPMNKINTGIEYMYGRRTNVDDNYGEAHRVQAMIKYIIN